jgi:hypothetical protein
MRCDQARKILNENNWEYDLYSRDNKLMDHLARCSDCASLAAAERVIRDDMASVAKSTPEGELSLAGIKDKIETDARYKSAGPNNRPEGLMSIVRRKSIIKPGISAAVLILLIIGLVPFKHQEKVGYGISISGVDRSIAVDNQSIEPFLDALGMEKSKSTALLDSLDVKELRLMVGECSETCHLEISDLKSEKDAQLLIKAIIDLGCCEIDDVFPIFRSESTSLLRQATRKLLS